ncbi:hypothetical protein ABZ135_37345 [Streptomyces sp. NPDC006339]|uniref:hypothetical protein n=1 Tax=Streptomyces sp. NPDC006339 TaxID=3156755 RepID=UPI0033A2EE00
MTTVLEAVLETHGMRCACESACGHHEGKPCKRNHYERPLLAAPYPPRATDAANAAVPVEDLRPLCAPCWRAAVKAAQDRAAEERRRVLEAAQLDLFDPAAVAAG